MLYSFKTKYKRIIIKLAKIEDKFKIIFKNFIKYI